MFVIREAKAGDESGIHEAHMRSIKEVCSRDHSADEIRSWGNRPLGVRWVSAIQKGFVWVVEGNGQIFGCAYLRTSNDHFEKRAYIDCLYLTPEALGQKLGFKMAQLMIQKAKEFGVTTINLDSTITAHDFYKKLGFIDLAPMRIVTIGESNVRCFPMSMSLV